MEEKDLLKNKKCRPCEDKSDTLSTDATYTFVEKINEWTLVEDHHIEKTLVFKNFIEALSFVQKVGAIAESEGHHPEIRMHGWNKVTITLFTHSIDGLSENDFILAAKIDVIEKI